MKHKPPVLMAATEPRTPQLAVGEIWYVLLPDAKKVIRAEILSMSACTVVLQEIHDMGRSSMVDALERGRFQLSDVEFIERVMRANKPAFPSIRRLGT